MCGAQMIIHMQARRAAAHFFSGALPYVRAECRMIGAPKPRRRALVSLIEQPPDRNGIAFDIPHDRVAKVCIRVQLLRTRRQAPQRAGAVHAHRCQFPHRRTVRPAPPREHGAPVGGVTPRVGRRIHENDVIPIQRRSHCTRRIVPHDDQPLQRRARMQLGNRNRLRFRNPLPHAPARQNMFPRHPSRVIGREKHGN